MSSVGLVSILGALAAIVVGLLSCFQGYRFFRVVLAAVGFVVGFGIGVSLVPADQVTLRIAAGFGAGLLRTMLLSWLYIFGFVAAGAILGGTLASTMLLALNIQNNNALAAASVVGIIAGGFVALLLNKWIIVVSTAFNGAALILYGAALLVPGLMEVNPSRPVRIESPWVVVIWLALGMAGFAFQARLYRDELGAKR
ncbi:MAG: DUF4203 domain-containing protein [Anaerolineae bacterium]